jgi:hypothetical protein
MCRRRLRPRLVDMMNDYTVHVLAEQRRQDLAAEAANHRLARLATADRTSWWHRLGEALPRPTHTPVARHRVAH